VDVLSIMSRTNQTDPETVDNLTEELFVTTRSYTATEDFEISFAADQLVLVVNRKKDDYWKVQMKDVVGWVLSRSVKPAEDIVGKATVIEKLKKIPNYNVTTCNAQAEKNKKKNMFTLGRKKENRTSLVDNRYLHQVEERNPPKIFIPHLLLRKIAAPWPWHRLAGARQPCRLLRPLLRLCSRPIQGATTRRLRQVAATSTSKFRRRASRRPAVHGAR